MPKEIELRRDKKTGEVYSYENGKKVGAIITMGDLINGKDDRSNKSQNRSNRSKG